MRRRGSRGEADQLAIQARKAAAGAVAHLRSGCQEEASELVRMFLKSSVAHGWTVVEAYAALAGANFELMVWLMSDDDDDKLYSLILEYAAHE